MRLARSIIAIFLFLVQGFVFSETTLPPIVASLTFDRDVAYIKEQIHVTLRVGYPESAFAMTQSKLRVSNAELFSLHKSEALESYQSLSYRFIETRYALFGSSAGSIELSGITFNATLPVSAGSGGSNPVINAVIEPQSIVVQEMPVTNFPAGADQWLAASQINISSKWPVFEEPLNPGIPVSRQIVIKVTGQHPAAVSEEINLKLPDGLRAYPASAITAVDKTVEGLEGSVVLPVTLVASKGGEYVLPEISLPWWDINDQQWRVAILPAGQLDIVETDGGGLSGNYNRALWLMCLLVMGLCFVCLWLWRRPVLSVQKKNQITSEKAAWQGLKQSVNHGSDADVRQAIVVWAQYHYPADSGTGLDQLCQRNPQLDGLVIVLEKRLYAKEGSVDLDRPRLMQVLAGIRKKARRQAGQSHETDSIYPQSIH